MSACSLFQGHPRLVVPDNLRAGIHKPSFYDPEVNRSYARMAAHYEVGILPAQPAQARTMTCLKEVML